MNIGNLRRRVRHEDVGGYKYERMDNEEFGDLNEPLLTRSDSGTRDEYDDWEEKKYEAQLVWSQIFLRLLAQWSQFFAALFNSAYLRGSSIFWITSRESESEEQRDALQLTPLQEERLRILQRRVEIPFDGASSIHQEALRELWKVSFPGCELVDLISEQWKDMGWQGKDPSTDFRGGGFISLENLLFFAKEYPRSYRKLLHKEDGCRATWEYPFAIAGINLSFMLIQILDLRSETPKTRNARKFVKLLEEDNFAFDRLYCVAFEMMDAQWLAMKASYMEFNTIRKTICIILLTSSFSYLQVAVTF
ncbi:hypothetical protein KP509_34G010200 [Ceratopteris richardii]|uniref:ELMO domain-containing protein n=1 Tax=Ceratopteris richardii TaxID=49495 RepID=A0A8T2QIR1_CERRI|nr:hypothetical protein KP509_34G010200 [Ceratopteris richardii]